MKALTAALFTIGLVGCYSHVELQAPPATAPLPERLKAYKELSPIVFNQTLYIGAGYGYGYVGGIVSPDNVVLAGGDQVHFPEDLAPVVLPNTPVTRAMERSASKRHVADALMGTGITTYVAGVGLAIGSVVYKSSNTNTDTSSSNFATSPNVTVPLVIGISAALIGAGLHVASFFVRRAADDEKSTVFSLFPGALKARLNLCDENNQIKECVQ